MGMLGSLFGAKRKSLPDITGLQIQTAVNTVPIPIIYGCPRVQMNIIYANGFRAVHNKSGGGGKGLLSGGKGATTTTYYATWLGALGEGYIPAVLIIFENQSTYTFSTAPSGRNMTFIPGAAGQAPISYITTNFPADAFGYTDTAYIGFLDSQLDSSATIPILNFIPQGLLAGTSPLNIYTAPDATVHFFDADPALCIIDFLTNATYGAGFPLSFIDTNTIYTSPDGFDSSIGDSALSTYCQAVGFAWSVVLNNTEPASSILDRWCKNMIVAPVWTGATLKFIPYYSSYSGANSGWDAGAGIPLKYFRPNIPVIFDLTDDDFIQSAQGEDPVIVSRIDPADVKNTVRIDYHDRGNSFNSNVSEAKDETGVDFFGPRVERMGSADEFTHGNYAGSSVSIRLQRNMSIRNSYTFRTDWRYCLLDPMDIVTITDSVLGLVKFPVRIQSIEEDEKGILTFIAEEFPLNSATLTVYPTQINAPPDFTTNAIPAAVNTPIIFEPTPQMLAAQGRSGPTIILGVSGGPAGAFDPNWGGCNIFASNDGVTYVQQGTISGPSRMGTATSGLPAYGGANPDNTNTLRVSLIESQSVLETVTSAQAAAGLSLCVLVDAFGGIELFCYTTATLVAANVYDLTGLYRGLYGTQPCAHSSGNQFLRVDTAVFETALPTAFIGELVSFKLQSFNTFNQSLQDISTCVVYTYTPTGISANPATNPIAAALLGGSTVDLNVADGLFDLNISGMSECSPVVFFVDLGVL